MDSACHSCKNSTSMQMACLSQCDARCEPSRSRMPSGLGPVRSPEAPRNEFLQVPVPMYTGLQCRIVHFWDHAGVPTLTRPMGRRTERDETISRTIWDRSVTFILIVGICISIVSFFVVRSQEIKSARDEFRLAAASPEYAVRRQIESNLATLQALRAWMAVTPDLRAEDADRYTKELARNNPGVLSLKWVARGGKLPEVDAPNNRLAMPMYLPVSEGPPGHERLRGYAWGLFQIGDVLERELRLLKPDTIDIEIYDLSAASGKQYLYGYRRGGGAVAPD